MRKLLFLLLILGSASAGAQTFRASLLAGGNFSQIDGDDLFGYHQFGLNAGIRVVAVLNDRWRVGPEILFSQQGARRNQNSANVSAFDQIDLNTLEIPLMVYFKDWRLTAEAGLSYQNLFSYTIISSGGEDITAATPLNSDLLAIKAGVTFFLTERLGLNMRFSKHLTNIDPDQSLNTSFKGKSISVRAVYTLGQGEELPRPAPDDF
ncbi:outer membrane beta-barrel protein [Neolewinella aurantiaca]|nr:outer membrane beta-barrel protein [Neolewinella aurantiaca]